MESCNVRSHSTYIPASLSNFESAESGHGRCFDLATIRGSILAQYMDLWPLPVEAHLLDWQTFKSHDIQATANMSKRRVCAPLHGQSVSSSKTVSVPFVACATATTCALPNKRPNVCHGLRLCLQDHADWCRVRFRSPGLTLKTD